MASSEFSDSSDKGEYANPTTSAEKNSAGVDVVRAHTGATILPDVQEQVPHDIEKGASGAIKGPPPGGFNPRQNPDGTACGNNYLCRLANRYTIQADCTHGCAFSEAFA